ncbi:hypothetical protein [Trinickia acidisoli]|uniref:hypothetical protein n=1 Tax=Trinickia acidisoli TaxID=2767482 RepID=UPI001A8F7AB2|nr:hypothetical protein [Trinickia acidisoli]
MFKFMFRRSLTGDLTRLSRRVSLLAFVVGAVLVRPAYAQMLPPVPAQGGATVLARAAQTLGIRQCYSAIDQVSQRVLTGSQRQDVVLDWDHNHADSSPFFSLTGFSEPGPAEVLSLTTVPNINGTCAVLAERISASPLPCPDVARRELVGYHGTPLVPSVMVYTTPARPRETVTLVENAHSCVLVRRQVEYGWPGVTK